VQYTPHPMQYTPHPMQYTPHPGVGHILTK
jgi:hypothetical protein